MPQKETPRELFAVSLEIPNATYAVKRKFMGRWRIRATSEWDYDYLSMIEEPIIEVTSSGYGTVNFGAFSAILDAMKDEYRPDEVMQFSFRGSDEGDEVCGRGCASIDGDLMVGRIVFNRGMSSNFEAEKQPKG